MSSQRRNTAPQVVQTVVETPEGPITVCTGEIPDSGSYQKWGMSTAKHRAKMGRRKTMRRRRAM